MLLQLLPWLSFLSIVIGMILMARKNKYGWLTYIMANILWAIYWILTHNYFIVLQELFFISVNIYGWHKWSSK